MSSYEAAWFLGLTTGHAVLAFAVALRMGMWWRWRWWARVGAALLASAGANMLLTLVLTVALVLPGTSDTVPTPLLAIFALVYFTVVLNLGGVLGTLAGSLLGCLLGRPGPPVAVVTP